MPCAVCRVPCREGEVPVLMPTARSTEEDLPLGLGLGADAYVTKRLTAHGS